MKKRRVFFLLLILIFLPVFTDNNSFEIIISFQKPSYILEAEEQKIICDDTKDECKINFDFRDSFIWDYKEKDFVCETSFWFINTEENKCNPNVIVVPKWEFQAYIKIYNKKDTNICDILNFKISNKEKKLPKYNYYEIQEPLIKIQSWLDEFNKSYKENPSINFLFETEDKNLSCLWDFWTWISKDENNKYRCNPSYVNFSLWKHEVTLKVCHKEDESNCKTSNFSFEVLKKIKISNKKIKDKILEEKIEKTDKKEIIEEKLMIKKNISNYTWYQSLKYIEKHIIFFIILLILSSNFLFLRKYNFK